MPSVIKATAIVNGDVITQTDVDQRLALPGDRQRRPDSRRTRSMQLRQQVLRNLIDETLEIQAPRAEKIEIKQSDIDRTVARVAGKCQADPGPARRISRGERLIIRSLRRQIEGEIAWQRLQRAKIESGQRRRRRGQGRPRQAERVEGHRGISRRRDLPVGDARHARRRPSTMPTRSWSSCATAHRSPATPGNIRKHRPRRSAATSAGSGPEQLPAPLADALRADAGRARSAIRFRSPAAFRSSPCRTRARS